MVPAYSFFLALRYLVSRWVNLLGMFGVAVAVWALIIVIAVFSGFIGEIRAHIHGSTPELLLTALPTESSYERIAPVLASDRDVVATAPRLRHPAMYYPYGRGGTRVQTTKSLLTRPLAFDYVELLGIDPAQESQTTGLRDWLDEVRHRVVGVADPEAPLTVPIEREEGWLRFTGREMPRGGLLRASPGILLSRRRLEFGNMLPGQRIDVVSARFDTTGEDPELRKIRRTFAASGAYETRHPGFDDTTAIVDIWELRAMLGHNELDPRSVDLVTDIAIRVVGGAELPLVAARLQDACREAGIGGEVLTWEQQNRVFLGAVDQERGMMKIILFAVMLVAAFLIYATLNMMVTQKIKDIGILTSMGAAPSGILNLFLIGGCTVAACGCAIGTVAGCLSAHYLNDLNDWTRANFNAELFPTDIYALDRIPYRIDVTWIVQVLVGALLISMIAAWLPARRAARMEPVRALAYE